MIKKQCWYCPTSGQRKKFHRCSQNLMQTFPQMSAKRGHNIIQGTWVVPLKQFVLQKLYNEKMFCRTLATGSQLSPSLIRGRCGNWGHDQWVQAGGGLALGLGNLEVFSNLNGSMALWDVVALQNSFVWKEDENEDSDENLKLLKKYHL